MRSRHFFSALMVFSLLWLVVSQAPAQQVTVGTPYHNLSDSFFERIGVDFDFNIGGLPGRPFMTFGRPAGAVRNTLDVDHGRSAVVGMLAPGVFSPDLSIPFQQNSYGLALPQFGGFDPGAGLRSGFHVRRKGFNASLNWTAGQGYRQNFVSQTPSVTLTNGQPGFISDTSQRPFVISHIPYVGGFPVLPYPYGYGSPPIGYPGYSMGNPRVQAMRRQMAEAKRAVAQQKALGRAAAANRPAAAKPPRREAEGERKLIGPGAAAARPAGAAQKLAAARSSSAGRAVPSVAQARRLHKLEQGAQHNEAMAFYQRGRTAEEGGKPNVAKIYYRMAAKLATGDLQKQIQARLAALN